MTKQKEVERQIIITLARTVGVCTRLNHASDLFLLPGEKRTYGGNNRCGKIDRLETPLITQSGIPNNIVAGCIRKQANGENHFFTRVVTLSDVESDLVRLGLITPMTKPVSSWDDQDDPFEDDDGLSDGDAYKLFGASDDDDDSESISSTEAKKETKEPAKSNPLSNPKHFSTMRWCEVAVEDETDEEEVGDVKRLAQMKLRR